MKTLIVPLAALAICGMAGAASAASPAYCALYAKEYVRQALADGQGSLSPTHVQDRAYSKCLNMDDEPPLPTAYVDPQEDGIGGPFVEEGSAAEAPDTQSNNMDQATLGEGDRPFAKPTRTGKRIGSGLPVGSPQWAKWCKDHYPNSFDPETGTVIPSATGVRTACQ